MSGDDPRAAIGRGLACVAVCIALGATPAGPRRATAAGRLAGVLADGLADAEGWLYLFAEVDLAREFVAECAVRPDASGMGRWLDSQLASCTAGSGYLYVQVPRDLAREFVAEHNRHNQTQPRGAIVRRMRIALALLPIIAAAGLAGLWCMPATGRGVTGGAVAVRLNLDMPDVADADAIHWHLVVTSARDRREVWRHRYPDLVVPVNSPALGSFVQDLLLPPGEYVARLSICDDVTDDDGLWVERPRVTTNVQLIVVP